MKASAAFFVCPISQHLSQFGPGQQLVYWHGSFATMNNQRSTSFILIDTIELEATICSLGKQVQYFTLMLLICVCVCVGVGMYASWVC